MSAALAFPDAGWDRQPRRGHLQLVPPPGDARRSDLGMQLTRRGRLTVTAGVLLTLVASLLAVVLAVLPADAGRQVVVQPGQTLSEIAVSHLPEVSLDRAMVQIQRANGLNSAQVQAGQTLVIPSR